MNQGRGRHARGNRAEAVVSNQDRQFPGGPPESGVLADKPDLKQNHLP
jgi:hypothetical protein